MHLTEHFRPPFDKGPKKVKVSSTYGDGTEATISCTVAKAVMAYCACMDGSRLGAIGLCGGKGVVEYKSSAGPDIYHLAVYDPITGSALASVYDSSTEIMEVYSLGRTGRDGAAIILAMFPALDKDVEFHNSLQDFIMEYRSSFPNMNKATELMAILCDNVYRRVNDSSCVAHLKVNILIWNASGQRN